MKSLGVKLAKEAKDLLDTEDSRALLMESHGKDPLEDFALLAVRTTQSTLSRPRDPHQKPSHSFAEIEKCTPKFTWDLKGEWPKPF